MQGQSPELSPDSRLLVVEDSSEDVFFLERAFQKAAFYPPFDHVTDGALAQDYLARRKDFSHLEGKPLPRLILSDIKMPFCTGLELLSWMRTRPELRLIPVVMWSSSDYEQDVRAADAVGASYYIRKPQTLQGFSDIARRLQEIWTSDCERKRVGALALTNCASTP